MQKLIVTIIFILVTSLILFFASKNSLPSSPLYNVKRLVENYELLRRTTPNEKAEYYAELLEERIYELEQLIPRKDDHEFILSSALRYSTLAGEYTQLIKDNNLKYNSFVAKVQFSTHSKELESFIKKYPRKNVGDRGDQFLIDSVNYLKIYTAELPDK